MPYRTSAPVANEPTMEQQLDRIFDVLERAPSNKWVFSRNCGDRIFTFKDQMVTLTIEESMSTSLGISLALKDVNHNILEKDTERLKNLFHKLVAMEQDKELNKKKSFIKEVYEKLRGL